MAPPSTDLLLQRLLAEEPFVRALARALAAGEADDVVQETWVRALAGSPPHLTSPRAWLLRLARNVALNLRRAAVRRDGHERAAAAAVWTAPSPAELVEREERRAAVVRAAEELPEPFRTTLMLRYFEGLLPRAIARRLDVPVATVWNRLRKALQLLRRRLDGDHGGDRRAWLLPLLPLAVPAVPAVPRHGAPGGLPAAAHLGILAMTAKLKLTFASATLAAAALSVWLATSGPPATAPAAPAALGTIAPAAAASASAPAPADVADAEESARRVAAAGTAAEGAAAASLRVRCLFDDGTPAAGIAVLVDRPGAGAAPREPLRAPSGAGGVATFAELLPGEVTVACMRQPYAPRRVGLVAGRPTEVELRLERGIDLRGLVVDHRDVPVAGATVEFGAVGAAVRAEPIGATDGEGRFQLRAVARMCRVGARAEGHAPSLLHEVVGEEGATVEVHLRLGPDGGAVAGAVTGPDGRPVAGARVQVSGGRRGERVTMLPSGQQARPPAPFAARTGEDGTFRASGLAPGEGEVVVTAPPFAPWRGAVLVLPHGTAWLDVPLLPGVTLAGTVRAPDGTPVAGARVVAMMAGFELPDTRTDAQGRYRIEALPEGELRLLAMAHQHGRVEARRTGRCGETVEWHASLPGGSEFAARVLDADGRPVAGAVLELMAQGWSAMGRTEADGSFRARGLPEGARVRAAVLAPGHVPRMLHDVDPAAGELVVRLERRPELTARIAGTVHGADGRPVEGLRIRAIGERESTGGTARCDGDGRFAVAVAAGRYRLQVEAEGHARWRSEVHEVGDGGSCDVGVVVLPRGGRLQVSFAGGPPPAGVEVEVRDGEGRLITGVDEVDGEWLSRLVAPGRHLLQLGGTVAAQIVPCSVVDGATETVAVEWTRGEQVRLQVFRSPGDRVQGTARVSLSSGRGPVLDRRVAGRGAGPVELSVALAPGPHRVTVVTAEGARGSASFTVPVAGPVVVHCR